MRIIQSSVVAFLGLTACHTSSEDLFVRNTGPQDNIKVGGAPSEYVWGHAYGSSVADRPHHVVALSDGGAILAGVFGGPQADAITDPTALDAGLADAGPVTGTVNLGGADLPMGSSYTGFIARYDATGATVWSLTLPGTGTSEVLALVPTADGGVIATGGVSGSIDLGGGTITVPPDDARVFVLKLDAGGHFVWARVLGDNAYGNGITIDDEGNIYVLGNFQKGTTTIDGIELSSTSQSTLIISLDAGGTTRWARLVTAADDGSVVTDAGPPGSPPGGGGVLSASTIASDANGIVLAGGVLGTVDIGTGPLPKSGYTDAIVLAFGKDGTPKWARRFGGPNNDSAGSIAFLHDGGIAIAGEFGGSLALDGFSLGGGSSYEEPFMAVLARDGQTTRWARAVETRGPIHEVSVSPQGELLGVGYASHLGESGAFGGFVGVFSVTDGALTRARAFPGNDIIASGGLDGNSVVIAGTYGNSAGATIDLGAGLMPKYGDSDIFVGKLQF